MAQSTGPILAIGVITVVNRTVFHDQPMDWRVPIAAGMAAAAFSLIEQVPQFGRFAPAIAWIALGTSLLSRIDPTVPSPTESALAWWQAGAGKK